SFKSCSISTAQDGSEEDILFNYNWVADPNHQNESEDKDNWNEDELDKQFNSNNQESDKDLNNQESDKNSYYDDKISEYVF
ncbi:3781_t:CDS:2, partial [Gigaspora margarita]